MFFHFFPLSLSTVSLAGFLIAIIIWIILGVIGSVIAAKFTYNSRLGLPIAINLAGEPIINITETVINTVDEQIIKARKECDYLIVIPHAGLELFDLPLPELKSLYRHFIDMGADAVIGGHPHVPQCWEIYKEHPIVYSLGNFCFDDNCIDKLWYFGLIAELICKDGHVSLIVELIHYDAKNSIVELSNNAEIFEFLKSWIM